MTSPQVISDRTRMYGFIENIIVDGSNVRYWTATDQYAGTKASATLSQVTVPSTTHPRWESFLIDTPYAKTRIVRRGIHTGQGTIEEVWSQPLDTSNDNQADSIQWLDRLSEVIHYNDEAVTHIVNRSVLRVHRNNNRILRFNNHADVYSSTMSIISTQAWSNNWGAILPNAANTLNSRLIGCYGNGVGIWNYTGMPVSGTPTLTWAGDTAGISIVRAIDSGTDMVVLSAAHSSTVLNTSRVDNGLLGRTTKADTTTLPNSWTAGGLSDMRIAWNNGRLYVVIIGDPEIVSGVPQAYWAHWNASRNVWSSWEALHDGSTNLTGTFEGLTMCRYPATDRLFVGIQTSDNFYYYNAAIDHEPHTPTWVTSDDTYDRTQELVLNWTYSDPTNDAMGGYQLRRTVGTTTHYLNASGQWVTAATTVDGDMRTVTLDANWGTDGTEYLFTIRVKDEQDNWSEWSTTLTVTASSITAPTITAPASNGATVRNTTFTWTTPAPQYGWRGVVQDASNNLLADTGWNLLISNRGQQEWSPSLQAGNGYVLTIHWQDADELRAQGQRTFNLEILGVPTPTHSVTMKDKDGTTVTTVDGLAVNAILAEIELLVPKLYADGTDGTDPQTVSFRRREIRGNISTNEIELELPIAESETTTDFVYKVSDHTIGHNRLYQWRGQVVAVNGELTTTDWFPT